MLEYSNDFSRILDADRDIRELERRVKAGTNLCVECCDRWPAENVAASWNTPDGQAIRSITFDQCKKLASQVSNYLASIGTSRGDTISVIADPSWELLIIALACWRAGFVFQPLSPKLAPELTSRRIDNGGARSVAIFVEGRYLNTIRYVVSNPIVVKFKRSDDPTQGDMISLAGSSSHVFEPVTCDEISKIAAAFTTGTTNDSKRVQLDMREVIIARVFSKYTLDLRDDDRYICLVEPSWSFGIRNLLLAPLSGGVRTTLVDNLTSHGLMRFLQKVSPTNIVTTPPIASVLSQTKSKKAPPAGKTLRVMTVGGGTLNPELQKQLSVTYGCRVGTAYGQTETGGIISQHQTLDFSTKLGSLGVANVGLNLVLLDDNLSIVEGPGVGQLAIDVGASPLFLFTGYYEGEPSLTWKYYLTGDRMRRDKDGCFYFLGRLDAMIKSAGHNIDPHAVERVLLQHPSVAEAAVTSRPDERRGQAIVALVVINGSPDLNTLAAELRKSVGDAIAPFAKPRQIEFVNSLPKTWNGKIDYRGLLPSP